MSPRSFAFGGKQHRLRRKLVNALALSATGAAAAALLIPLFGILGFLIAKGASSLNWAFFTASTKPVGEVGGGVANAIAGSLLVVSMAAAFAWPFGIALAVYLNEFGKRSRLAWLARMACDMLNSTPSIILGIFAYAVVVVSMGHFSAISGSFALAVLMIPVVVRGTEEVLRNIPDTLRQGSLALGATPWQTVWRVVLPAARRGIVTSACLAVARVGGETAPLLFTAYGNEFWKLNPLEAVNTLPLQIYKFAGSPYEDWHRMAWAAALVLVLAITSLNLLARALTYTRHRLAS